MSLSEQKSLLRERLQRLRKGLAPEDVRRWSEAICERALALSPVRDAGWVMCYVSVGNEVGTRGLIRALLERGKRVAVPLVHRETGELSARLITDLDKDLQPGALSIPEPIVERTEECPLDRLEVVFVPGVAFDERGNRLGRGGGYFDRFLARLSPAVCTVGLAFECQIVEEAPMGPRDRGVQLVVTEKRVIGAR